MLIFSEAKKSAYWEPAFIAPYDSHLIPLRVCTCLHSVVETSYIILCCNKFHFYLIGKVLEILLNINQRLNFETVLRNTIKQFRSVFI